MRFSYQADTPLAAKTDAIVVPMSEAAVAQLPSELKSLDRALDGLITAAIAIGDFKGEEHTTFTLLSNGKIPAARILLVGIGKPKDRTLLEWQHVIGIAARILQVAKVTRWALVLPRDVRRAFRPEGLGCMTAKGVLVATYHFTQYKSDTKAVPLQPEEIAVGPLTASERRKFEAGVREGMIVGRAMNWMRDFGNMPSSDATPTFLAKQAAVLAKTDKRLHLKVIDRPEMEKLGMGALLGVARGAATPPKCIVLEWRGAPKQPKAWRALVGKAISFDSGGFSIKPGVKLDEMMFDMSGGAAVLGGL
ncbi:hypothetical protein HY634_03535 [Candidatus Uhrbacteria bacterium]|nr:hypothetical protein [Candidatus Uhrbacteria bacterium]